MISVPWRVCIVTKREIGHKLTEEISVPWRVCIVTAA